MSSVVCFSCHKENKVSLPVGRRDECAHCGADLHVCKNCRFFDPKSYNECKEPQADVVLEKERSNFCDHFNPGGQIKTGPSKEDLLAAAEALFKKK